MKQQKLFFGKNIKFLRERKKISQESLAQKLGITRSKLNALENEQTKAPQPLDYISFSDFFKISIDSLLKVDLSLLSELKLRQLEAGNDVYMMGTNIRILAITVNKKNEENMEYVPIKAKAGYRSGYNDPEFIAGLPRFSLPNLPKSGTFRMFPTTGDSMLPIPEGSDIIAEYAEDWKGLKRQTLCIVILKAEQDFIFKQVSVQEDGTILLESLNREYPPYSVAAEDVLEIWRFKSYHTHLIPEVEPDLQQMAKSIKEIKAEIQSLKR